MLVGLLVLWKFDDSIRKAKWLSEDEKQILEANIAADNKGKTLITLTQSRIQTRDEADGLRRAWGEVFNQVKSDLEKL